MACVNLVVPVRISRVVSASAARSACAMKAAAKSSTDNLVEVEREEIVESRLRRYYRLTPAGRELLAAEAARLQANAHAAMSRLEPAAGVVR